MRYNLRTLLILLAVAVWCLPVMYFLSIAPARKLVHEGSLPQDAYLAIYGPLLSAPVVGDWARHYARWWVEPIL